MNFRYAKEIEAHEQIVETRASVTRDCQICEACDPSLRDVCFGMRTSSGGERTVTLWAVMDSSHCPSVGAAMWVSYFRRSDDGTRINYVYLLAQLRNGFTFEAFADKADTVKVFVNGAFVCSIVKDFKDAISLRALLNLLSWKPSTWKWNVLFADGYLTQITHTGMSLSAKTVLICQTQFGEQIPIRCAKDGFPSILRSPDGGDAVIPKGFDFNSNLDGIALALNILFRMHLMPLAFH